MGRHVLFLAIAASSFDGSVSVEIAGCWPHTNTLAVRTQYRHRFSTGTVQSTAPSSLPLRTTGPNPDISDTRDWLGPFDLSPSSLAGYLPRPCIFPSYIFQIAKAQTAILRKGINVASKSTASFEGDKIQNAIVIPTCRISRCASFLPKTLPLSARCDCRRHRHRRISMAIVEKRSPYGLGAVEPSCCALA